MSSSNVLYILMIILLIKNYCLSQFEQFHQDDYEIDHDRFDIHKVNKTACLDPVANIFKYNDTLKMKAINLSATFTPGVKKNILINFAVFRLVRKKYRIFPFPNMTIDLCDEYRKLGDKNPFGMRTAVQKSNFRGCPCPMGLYYLYNWVIEQEKFPPHLPPGDYKVAGSVRIDDNTFLISGAWYGSIIKKKKH